VDVVNRSELHISAVFSYIVRISVAEFIDIELRVATDDRDSMSQTSARGESFDPVGSMNGLMAGR
jgi:hypothetical protein